MDWLTDPQALIALMTLTALEVILGIDNIIFISILSGKLPPAEQPKARQIGLLLALVGRILLVLSISLIMKLTQPLVTVMGKGLSGRDLILLAGGLFLVGKATKEIHEKLEGATGEAGAKVKAAMASVLIQISLLNLVFSIDSVITAVGMTSVVPVMVTAIIASSLLMMAFASSVTNFIERHPTFKILALSFLILIGVSITAEGFGAHLPKGYIYFAMAFSFLVEIVNMRIYRTPQAPVKLHSPYQDGDR